MPDEDAIIPITDEEEYIEDDLWPDLQISSVLSMEKRHWRRDTGGEPEVYCGCSWK